MTSRPLNVAARLTPRAALAIVLASLALASCETTGPSRGPIPERIGSGRDQGDEPQRDDRQPIVDRLVTPPHRGGDPEALVRVGLLLPFSAPNAGARAEAASMLNAAQLALFETDAARIVLIPKDTGGTPEGARRQAREVLREGANVILGPLFSDSVPVVVDEASVYDKPVIAFSNIRSAAETGAYLLSVTPEEEVARVVSYASRQGVITFATLAPDNDYGQRVRDAAEQAARDNGGFLVTWEVYPEGGDATMIDLPARRLARYDSRLAARAAEQEDQFELPYDAVILPEGGIQLLSLAPSLPTYDVDPRITRFLGISRWQDPAVSREPSLAGGWFPGPDADAHAAFAASYVAAFGEEPTRLAPLAYDGMLAIASLTRGLGAAGLTPQGFQRPTGFRGADGLFRFNADRISEHTMAIYEVRNGAFVVIEPAPDSFAPEVF
jgi:ABC-type branched-subunit amino acid transport system substrate-binding protein